MKHIFITAVLLLAAMMNANAAQTMKAPKGGKLISD